MVKVIKEKRIYFYTCLCVLISFLVVLFLLGIYPFGNKSLLIWDLNIQYVEFFSYFRKVLMGEASIAYSFSKSLGGSMVATYGYYLSSPLNLLVIFFKQEDMQLFILLITIIKVVLCGLSSACFFKIRFKNQISDTVVMLISCGYALSQYTLSQMSNIMWLDGVYLLPIVLLGVWKYVEEKKKIPLVLIIACSIIFNWYTGYMNCLFIPFYYLFEELKHIKYDSIFNQIREFLKFCFWEAVGVGVSSFFFIPVVCGLKNGKGSFSFDIFNFQTNGSLFDIIRGFVLGSDANSKNISLFFGSFFLIEVIAFFFNDKISKYEKKLSGALLSFLIFGLFFKPLENIWNGFRYVYSYFYRFSYIIIFYLLYLVAVNIINKEGFKKTAYKIIILSFIGILLILDEVKAFNPKKLWVEIMILFGILILKTIRESKMISRIISVLVLGELILNGFLICKPNYVREQNTYINYTNEQNKIVNQIREIEGENNQEFYRVEQTKNRGNSSNKLNAYYDEALAYGYNGIAQYSSAFDACPMDFIAKLGYSDVHDITLYNEPILSSDSLLRVKYLLADAEYPGWINVGMNEEYNGKQIYENPYAFPLAIQRQEVNSNLEPNKNPFLYQNEVFSELMGYDVEIFKRLESSCESYEKKLQINIGKVDTDGIIYGYGRFKNNGLKVYIDGSYRCDYEDWLSYLVFNVGTTEINHVVEFENAEESIDNEIEFYYLDMDLFKQIQNEMKKNEAKVICWEDGYVEISCQPSNNKSLLLTVPFDKGWRAYCGEKEIEVKKAVDGLIQVPIESTEENIVLKYEVPGEKIGIIISVLSVIILILGNIKRCKTNEKTNIHSSALL